MNKYNLINGNMVPVLNETENSEPMWIRWEDAKPLIANNQLIKNRALTRVANRIEQEIKLYNNQSYFMQQGLARAKEFITAEYK